jgi:acylpyruvate hydrolase
VDWEAELTIVIGREARGVDRSDALDHVAGYAVANDVSMRDWQNRTLQWLQGKNFEGTTPVGPVLVTPDEIDHASDLRISCTLNDEVVQDSRTSDLIFPPAELVAYISTFTTLRPGDLILTGTPAGVGHARTPPRFIGVDDVVTVAVEGIGECRNRFTKVPS